jgi:hypothetical protein
MLRSVRLAAARRHGFVMGSALVMASCLAVPLGCGGPPTCAEACGSDDCSDDCVEECEAIGRAVEGTDCEDEYDDTKECLEAEACRRDACDEEGDALEACADD